MNNSGNNLIQRFQQFKQSFTGNPQQQVQQLLNSGKVSQAQYNQAVQMAQQFQQFLTGAQR
jgi:vancomycin permeability regulator SanA